LVSDGPHTAARLAAIGAGVSVALESAPRDLPVALRRVLCEPSFSRNASLVAAEMARYPSAGQVLARIRAAIVDARPRAGVHRGVSDSPSGREAGGGA
jgi:UDP:flavonoid glycosyltransferase YjiC (YdhE family)